MPMVDRTPEEAPPIIIGVVGPPGVSLFDLFIVTTYEAADIQIDGKNNSH